MLDNLRDEIKSIDAKIASLVARRFELALEVGKEKEKTGQPVRDVGIVKTKALSPGNRPPTTNPTPPFYQIPPPNSTISSHKTASNCR